MNLEKAYNKLFVLNAWSIGYREISGESAEPPIGGNVISYRTIPVNDHMYYADPFVVEREDSVYLFAESMNRYRGIGTISVAEMAPGGTFSTFREILREPFHLSFPNVFRHDGQYFMIPETSAVKQVRLYQAVEFPYRWELDTVLLDNGNPYVDSVLAFHGEEAELICYYETASGGVTERYRLDMDQRTVEKLDAVPPHSDRPAGNVLKIGQDVFRPMQNCEGYYGKGTFLYRRDGQGAERLYGEIRPENFRLMPAVAHLTGTHTFNRSEHYEVVDFRYDRFCPSKRVIWAAGKCKSLLGRRKDVED